LGFFRFFAYLAANYLFREDLATTIPPSKNDEIDSSWTVGALDLGGASAQVCFHFCFCYLLFQLFSHRTLSLIYL